MQLSIIKCHGSGNDFPLIDARELRFDADERAMLARLLADRSGPVGGDGLLLLEKMLDGFSMRMLNSDGSEAETCLNGLRCVARLGFERLGCDEAVVQLKTSRAYVRRAEALAPGVYTVAETAGPADLKSARWLCVEPAPHTGSPHNPAERIDRAIPGLPSARAFTAVAMPNPHLIAFVDRIDEAELRAVGASAQATPALLPERANVSFVEVRGPDRLFVRTFERGVGLTDSCGSAMAAATFSAALTGRIDFARDIVVLNRGGRVRANVARDAMITIHGNATWEWAGTIEVDPVRGTIGALHVTERFDGEIAAWQRVATAAA